MEVCRTIEALRQLTAKEVRAASLGLVPTMGALHEGHLSLVRRAREENELVAVSIFVNPLQFGEGEDFEVYPRTEDEDLRLLREAGVDCVLCGEVQDLYPDGFSTSVQVRGITEVLEGAERPGHFDGVTTVVLKLFQIFEPTRAYFGEKDFQQLAVIRRMCIDLDLPIEIRPCPIVREKDGLALSSRNRYLPENARKLAPSIYRALLEAKGRFDHGMCEISALQASVRAALEPAFDVDYVAVRGSEDFRELRGEVSGGRLLVTARIGNVRLLDNLEL